MKIILEFPDAMAPLLQELATVAGCQTVAEWIQKEVRQIADANAEDYGYHPLTWEREEKESASIAHFLARAGE